MPVDISKCRHSIAEKYHYNHDDFTKRIASRILGSGGNWGNSSDLQSCAMRLSIALAYAGVHFPRVENSWRLKGTNVYFPSLASDYPDKLLSGGETIKAVSKIKDRKGAIYFGGDFNTASGHVTLWNGKLCHWDPSDSHWSQPKIVFWEMA